MMDMKGGFVKNLPKVYGLYTGGFAVFILIMAIAEQAGVSAKTVSYTHLTLPTIYSV